jgi:basic membrane protein A
LADATEQFAKDNPDTSFAIVDHQYDPPIDNVRGLTFSTNEAGFLAGYVAAAATQTGKVATFGGIKIPPVTIFMVGFESGVEYYNAENGTDVEVLGWDTDEGTGLFVGNFESTEDGRSAGEDFLNEGADVIMPVAGPVGLGTAQAVQASGDAWLIGVDADWTLTAPEYEDVILTSVMKRIDNAVFDTIEVASSDDFDGFQGETYVGTLENEGVGLADVADGAVDQAVIDELESLRQGITDGEIDTGWDAYLAAQGE